MRLAPLLLLAACAQAKPLFEPRLTGGFARLPFAAAAAPALEAETGKMSLAQAYQLALARNEQVALAERNMDTADINWTDRSTAMGPTFLLTATGALQVERSTMTPSGENLQRPGQTVIGAATLSQPLYRRGFFDSRAAGKANYDSAAAAYKRQRQTLAHDVAAAFIEVLKARRLKDLAISAFTRAKSEHDFAGARVKAGQALKNAELLALVDLKRAELQQLNAQRAADAAAITFQRLVGRPPAAELEMPTVPAMPDPKQANDLAKRRPDLQALELNIEAAKNEHEAALGRRWWPRLDLDATALYQIPAIGPANDRKHFDYQVLGVLTIPIIQTGHEFTDISLRENEVHIAELELTQQGKIANEETGLAVLQMTSAAQAVDIAKLELDAAKEHYTLVDKQVRLGAITFLEVANAQAVLVEAENAFEVANMDRLRASYDYLFAIGALDLDAK